MKKVFISILTLTVAIWGVTSCVKNEDPPPPPDPSPLKGILFINEVNGWHSDDANKNFELYNASDEDVSLKDFVVKYTEDRETWRGRDTDIIPAKGYKLIKGAQNGYPGFNTGLSNRNPNVYLDFYDDKGNLIDSYKKKTDLRNTYLEYMCHARIPDGGTWYCIPTNMETPGAANPAKVPDDAAEITEKGDVMIIIVEKTLKMDIPSVSPALPKPDENVTISVKVTDEKNTVTSVVLKWKKDGADQPEVDITASKDDNLYTAIIDKQADGTVIEWTIEAANDKGQKMSQTGQFTFKFNSPYSKLKLNEVNGFSATGDVDKFYELINIGDVEISLAGVTIDYNANSNAGENFPPAGNQGVTWMGCTSQTIAPGGLFVIQDRSSSQVIDINTCATKMRTGLTAGRILIITLKDPDGNTIDQCIRAKDTAPYDITNKSFSRIPDGTGDFYFTTSTPNEKNGTSTTELTPLPITP